MREEEWPVDSDVDLRFPAQREELAHPAAVLGAIAAGGALGAEARAGLAAVLPTAGGGFPVGTLLVNVTGCLLIGVLMVLVTETKRGHPLTRPFLGVGVLGGYTTFSGYAVDAQRLLAGGHVATAVTALALTPVLALLAVTVAAAATRRVIR
ncbi:MAG TPA: CrcB family protein [Mycobacteriales bacterium]|nr:CrcB family protein [Mycobacteriales bacterium]